MTSGKTADIFQFAYRKQRMDHLYSDLADVPEEFILEWYKDRYDYPRLHSREEVRHMMSLPSEAILHWLDEAVQLVWTMKRKEWADRRRKRAGGRD